MSEGGPAESGPAGRYEVILVLCAWDSRRPTTMSRHAG